MSLDRRVQVLLDPKQYLAVEREAARSGQSVGALIRDSIARRLAAGDSARAAAARRLLASADTTGPAGEDWSDAKAALEGELTAKLP